MATKFKYEARDHAGKVVKGTVSASSQSDAVAEVRRKNLTPLDISKPGGIAALL